MLKLLLKTRLLALIDQFSGQKNGRKAISTGRIILLTGGGLLLLALIGLVLSMMLAPLYDSFSKNNLAWLYYAGSGALGFVLSFMVTMFYAQGAIFEAKDNEMLLSMPIPPRAILASRIGTLYFLNLVFSATIMVTAGIVKVIVAGTSFLSVLFFILCVALLAFVSTTLSCLLGWLVSLVTRRIRRKSLFSLIFSLAFLGAFMFIAYSDMQSHIRTIMENQGGIAEFFRGPMYPFQAMGTAITNTDPVQLLIFAACCLAPFALVCFALSASFIRIVTTKTGAKKVKYEAKKLKTSPVAWAMAKKDLLRLGNSSSYMLNACMGLLFALILGGGTLAAGRSVMDFVLERFAHLEGAGKDVLPFLSAVILSVLGGYCYITGPSISVESRNLWILKSIPTKAGTILKGKLLAHLVVALPVSLAASLLFALAMPMSAPEILAVFLMPLLAHTFSALTGLIINLYFGRTDFPSEAKAVKSNSAALAPLLLTGILSLVPSILYFTVLSKQGIPFSTPIFAGMGLFLVLDAAMYLFLNSAAAQKRWDKIGQ